MSKKNNFKYQKFTKKLENALKSEKLQNMQNYSVIIKF